MVSSWRDLIEARIREARDRGLLRGLRGEGAPLDDELADLPAEARMDARIASVGVAPPEVERARRVRELRERLAKTTDPEARKALLREIRDAEIERDVLLERTGRAVLVGRVRRIGRGLTHAPGA